MKTPRPYNTLEELDASIRRDVKRINDASHLSTTIRNSSLTSLFLYYHGYCDAMEWTPSDNALELLLIKEN